MSQTQSFPLPDDDDATFTTEKTHHTPMQQKRNRITHIQHKIYHKINIQRNKTGNDLGYQLLEMAAMATGATLSALVLCEYILKPLWHIMKM